MKLIIQYIRRHIGSFCAAIFFLTVEAMADLLQPTFMSHIVDDGVKNMDVRRILSYGVIMFMIALVGAFGAVMRNLFASRTSQTIGKEMRSDMFRKVQNLSLENIDRLQPASIMVPRFYDATRGKVCIDGIDVKKMDEKELRRAIAVVPQKALLFYGTILENLRWGRKEATETEMKQAAEIACADSFIMQTENGYDTLLGQGGVNLSGGQKQRLALARALVRNPKVLILDDCTSALDAETEAAVLSGLHRHLQKVTVLLISQRISTVRRADRILCLENGTVQGIGSHEELMATCPTYQAIYHSQIGGRENG